MPPSVDSSACTPSACLTRSTWKRRNPHSSKVASDVRKKARGSSSLSETSPGRPDNLDLMGQLTQESERRRDSRKDNDAFVHLDLPSVLQPQQGYFPSLMQRKIDGFLKRAPLSKVERLASEDLDGSIRSMILHLSSLTRSILAAYEKERNQDTCGTELAQQRACNEATASELARLRAIHEATTLELSRLRISNEAANAEVANLELENASLLKKEVAASSKLDEFRRQCPMRDAVNILAAFIISKAIILKDHAELDKAGSSEVDNLRPEKAQAMKETRDIGEQNRLQTRDIGEKKRLQILDLQSLVAAEDELSKLRSEKAELMKEKDEKEANTSLAAHDMLCRLETAMEEVKQTQLNAEADFKEKDEAAERFAQAAALELEMMESRNAVLLGEIQTSREAAGAEIERLKSTLESTKATLKEVILEKEEMAREKLESESSTKTEIIQLESEKAALVAEQERTSAMANREFKRLSSRLENAVENIETIRHTTGLEKAKLQSEIQAKNSELVGLNKMLTEVQAAMATRDAQRAAEVDKLSREKEEGHAREAALLEKLQASTALPRSHAEMHLAFLTNWGLIRPEDYNLRFMRADRS
ncbi:unnamed protein product [Calypogeia fissa]